MVTLNLTEEPIFIRTKLLLHPIIPKSLSGVNPRRLKGKEWWDKTRKAAYAGNNYCCWACGVHRLDTEEQLLDGHETYKYHFRKRVITYDCTVALCRPCHQFIHFNATRTINQRIRVLARGLAFLWDAGLDPPYAQSRAAAQMGLSVPIGAAKLNERERDKAHSLYWKRWTLKFGRKKYKGR